jgi:Peptidase family M20/M25/M40
VSQGGSAGGEDAALAELLAERTAALCGYLSPIGEERALCDQVEAWAGRRFPHVRRVKSSLVVLLDGPPPPGGPQPLVVLCGHLDTVPVHEADRGGPRRDGGRLVAPGASDMKGGVALMMALAEALPAAERCCGLALVFYAREEGPYLENELGDVLAAAPELSGAALAICLEPTDNRLQLGCLGSIHATVTFTGPPTRRARGRGRTRSTGPARSWPSWPGARRARRTRAVTSSARCSPAPGSRAGGRATWCRTAAPSTSTSASRRTSRWKWRPASSRRSARATAPRSS